MTLFSFRGVKSREWTFYDTNKCKKEVRDEKVSLFCLCLYL